MRIAIIAVIALLVIGGGGAGAYFYFAQKAQASIGEEAKNADKKHADAKKGEHGEGEEGIEYVKLDPLILPIVDAEGLTQVVSLVIAIEVSNPGDKTTVEQLVPRLTDAFIQDMYGALNGEAMKGGVIQVGMIKERLNKISSKVLGGKIDSDVLLQVVQQRPA